MALTNALKKLRKKGWFYWMTVVLLVAIGVLVGHWLEKQQFALQLRYSIYQFFTQVMSPRKAIVERTVVVLIGDEEFWKGEPARRIPIKRSYLANIIQALDGADPAVIAVDFDLRSQLPDGSFIEHDDYKKETDLFLKTVRDVSARRPVVLPKTIKLDGGYYTTESDIHDPLPEGGGIRKGYISLPFDYRKVPLVLNMKDGVKVDSFAEAIVRAVNEKAIASVEGEEDSAYGTYLPTESFTVLSSAEVLSQNEKILKKLRHNIVIIGAGWSNRAYGRGGMADLHFTPVGPIQGALLHANYVEALLDQRTARSWGEVAIIIVDVILSFAIAGIFVLVSKFHWKLVSLLILLCFLALVSYFSWLNLGLFYDFFVPTVLVAVHSIYEQLRELHSEARKRKEFGNSVFDKPKYEQEGSSGQRVAAESRGRYTVTLLFASIFIASTTILLGRVVGIVRSTTDTSAWVTVFTAVVSAIGTVSTAIFAWRKDRRDAREGELKIAQLERELEAAGERPVLPASEENRK